MPYELAVHQLLVRASTIDPNPYDFPTLLSHLATLLLNTWILQER